MPSLTSNSLQEWIGQKILDPNKLESTLPAIRHNKTVATINGSFDLLHAGHLYMLFEAAKVADILLVLVNSDASVRSYKGESRPIIALQERMEMLSALAFVDYVTYFEESDPRAMIRRIRPNWHVNGAEYGTECIEAEAVKEVGANLHLVERIPGLATSAIIEKVQHLCDSSAR